MQNKCQFAIVDFETLLYAVYRSCDEFFKAGHEESGVNLIKLNQSEFLRVYCDQQSSKGAGNQLYGERYLVQMATHLLFWLIHQQSTRNL